MPVGALAAETERRTASGRGHGRLRFEQSLEQATSAPQQAPVRTKMEMLLHSVSNMLWRASGGVASAISRETDGSSAGSQPTCPRLYRTQWPSRRQRTAV